MIIIWTNLVDPESSMLYTKIQPWSFLGSGEEDSYVFLPYMGMVAILFNYLEPFEERRSLLTAGCHQQKVAGDSRTFTGDSQAKIYWWYIDKK